jgi:hypothetical protein
VASEHEGKHPTDKKKQPTPGSPPDREKYLLTKLFRQKKCRRPGQVAGKDWRFVEDQPLTAVPLL